MDMSSLHNGETRWHFLGCCTLNQRDQQYVECQRGDIWFPFHSCGITVGMPADITVLPSWRWACQTSHSTSVFSETIHVAQHFVRRWLTSWYFDYLREVWLNKGDSVSLTFSISLWRQTGERSQSADWTLGGGGGLFEALLRICWGCWFGHLIYIQTYTSHHSIQVPIWQGYRIIVLFFNRKYHSINYSYPECMFHSIM